RPMALNPTPTAAPPLAHSAPSAACRPVGCRLPYGARANEAAVIHAMTASGAAAFGSVTAHVTATTQPHRTATPVPVRLPLNAADIAPAHKSSAAPTGRATYAGRAGHRRRGLSIHSESRGRNGAVDPVFTRS